MAGNTLTLGVRPGGNTLTIVVPEFVVDIGPPAGVLHLAADAVGVSVELTPGTVPGAFGSLFISGFAADIASEITPGTIPRARGSLAIAGFPVDIDSLSGLSPTQLLPGYSFDGANLVIPISDLLHLNPANADAVSGSWPDIFQSLLLAPVDRIESAPIMWYYKTIHFGVLEDWNRRNIAFGRHMKRLFLVEFTVENSPTNVFNSGE